MSTNDYKAEDLVTLLKKRYVTDDGAYNPCVVLEQVPDGTGWTQSRWIDVAVFQMWKTKGLTRSAFEVKVSRSDFISELSNPQKHQWCKECFHYFWFVAPKNVIQLEELPPNVGWMYPKGNKLAVARHAVKNESPKLDDSLLAAFMRAAYKMLKKTEQITSREVMANDPEHQRAMRYMKGTIQFLNSRGKNSFLLDDSEQNIIETLEEATMDKQLLQDREHLLNVTGQFQRNITALLTIFEVIASKSLLERDDLGNYIVTTYGGHDSDGLKALKERAKDKKTTDYEKAYAELVELVMNLGNGSKSKP